MRSHSSRSALCIVAIAWGFAVACESPGPPTKASSQQIDAMNQEIGSGSGSFGKAADWSAMTQSIRTARDSVDRMHWIAEFAHHAAALPESLRVLRMAELQQVLREVR